MKIIVLGNSCSGKSTLISRFNASLKFPVIAIDDFRAKFGNFTWQGDQKAVNEFIKAIKFDRSHQIIECSGTGKTGEKLRLKISSIDDNFLIIFVCTENSLCSIRASSKMWHELKMPGDWKKSLSTNILNYNLSEIMNEYPKRIPIMIVSNLQEDAISEVSKLINTEIHELKRR